MQYENLMRRTLFYCLWIFSSCAALPTIPDKSQPKEPSASVDLNPSLLRITALNIGQGDATVIQTPTGEAILIDGGPSGSGLGKIIPFLEEEKIDQIETILVSHYDADHIAGLLDLIPGRDKTLGTVDDWVPLRGIGDRGDEESRAKPLFAPYSALTNRWRYSVKPGDHWSFGEVEISALVINGTYLDGRSLLLSPEDENGRAMALLIQYREFRYLTSGDLTGGGPSGITETADLETHLAEIVGPVTALHINHHGSVTSSNERFLHLLQPEAFLISVGKDNDYGHPAPSVLKRLESTGTPIYRTDLMGDITIETDGTDTRIETSKTP
ncbi:MAG: MBL fold metallo-hydrolase [Deltaproteobacteria bacterium]|nr:MBL fold metallo-hydrolase [Deltaproteobacteria bacterium]